MLSGEKVLVLKNTQEQVSMPHLNIKGTIKNVNENILVIELSDYSKTYLETTEIDIYNDDMDLEMNQKIFIKINDIHIEGKSLSYSSIEIYKQENKLVINAQSEAAFFDGVQFTVEIEGEIAQEDVEIIWMTIGGNTEYVEGNDRIIAEIKISDNDELICDTKINFAKKAIDAIEDVLERNGM